LLAEEEPVDKLAAFARQVEEAVEEERKTSDKPAPNAETLNRAEAEAEAGTPPVRCRKLRRILKRSRKKLSLRKLRRLKRL